MKLSVFGLGYVGCVSAACLAAEGHEVIGVDVNPSKVDRINGGQAPIVEEGVSELIGEQVARGRLRATTSAAEAVAASEASLVAVGTPSRANGSLELDFVLRVCAEIGEAIANKGAGHTVILRSTVLPGASEGQVIPALERGAGRRCGDGIEFGFNPEFLREGSSIRDFYDPTMTVVGSESEAVADLCRELYKGVGGTFVHTAVGVAETIKYASNLFHALKVTFANEVGALCRSLGIDSREVMRLFVQDRKLNIAPTYLQPGFAFGGSCLPKDLRAFLYCARDHDLSLPVLEQVLVSNQVQVERILQRILDHGRGPVVLLGLAFKAGTDDLRESPLVILAERLIGKGVPVRIFDANVSVARLMGANRSYVEQELPHLSALLGDDLEAMVEEAAVVVVGNRDPRFAPVAAAASAAKPVIDLAGCIGQPSDAGPYYEGVCW